MGGTTSAFYAFNYGKVLSNFVDLFLASLFSVKHFGLFTLELTNKFDTEHVILCLETKNLTPSEHLEAMQPAKLFKFGFSIHDYNEIT